jgi:sec-independent protein translocase protein TatC
MTLVEHIRELRSRLFKGSLGVLLGLIVGIFYSSQVQDFINRPYCDFQKTKIVSGSTELACRFVANSPVDPFLLKLKIGLYVGLLLASPIWLYQLWAFVAPGLHRRERRYTYAFTAAAVPLFASGAFLAFFVVSKSLRFFLAGKYSVDVNVSGYFSFVTGVMLLFGAAFEFPLLVLMLNFAGVLSANRMFSWWRPAIFLMFVFAAIVTPTPDPFGMTVLAVAMAVLYFGACGIAYLNDRRRARRNNIYAGLSDDEISPLGDDREPVEAGEPVDAVTPVTPPRPLDRSYDDMT